MLQRKQLTKEQALQKLRHYCAYQERSHVEVKEKLYSFGLRKQMVEESIAQLIEEDYLNEERFAIQFAGGKFRMKQWGRVKIIHALKQKQVSTYCINKAIKELDGEAYDKTLNKLAKQKWSSVKGVDVNLFVKMGKTTDYLLQKGYEPELVRQVVGKLKEMKNEEGLG
jgi:regulatory protein